MRAVTMGEVVAALERVDAGTLRAVLAQLGHQPAPPEEVDDTTALAKLLSGHAWLAALTIQALKEAEAARGAVAGGEEQEQAISRVRPEHVQPGDAEVLEASADSFPASDPPAYYPQRL